MAPQATGQVVEDRIPPDQRAARDRALANLGRIVCASLARERGGQWSSLLPVRSGGAREGEA